MQLLSSLAFIVNKEKIMAFSPTDGKTKWSFSKPNQQFTKLKSPSYFYSGFADKVQEEYSFIFHDFSDKSLFVMGSDSTLSALDINTGKLIWDYKLRGMPPVTYGNGLVYVPDSSSRVKAIDAITGKTRWESKLDSSAKIISKPYYFDGKLIFSAKNESGIVTGYSYFLDAADGQLITKTGGYCESTASDDSTIYRNSLGDINAYDKKTLSFKWRHFTTTEVHTLFLQKGRLVWHGFFGVILSIR
jgi:outer membrane protein assembly factor BamB